jgi:hypothetical protein
VNTPFHRLDLAILFQSQQGTGHLFLVEAGLLLNGLVVHSVCGLLDDIKDLIGGMKGLVGLWFHFSPALRNASTSLGPALFANLSKEKLGFILSTSAASARASSSRPDQL